jgi:hypothetical protein
MKKVVNLPDKSEPLISGPSLAERYEVDPATVRRWKREGMPCHAFNQKLVRYKITEVEVWLSNRWASKTGPASNRSGLRNQVAAQ